MSIFTIKLIAMIAMLGDHIGHVFGRWGLLPFSSFPLRWVGRLSFPIYAFCIINGWQHTRDKKKYLKNLLLCANASQIPFSLAFNAPNLQPIGMLGDAFRFIFAPVYLLPAAVMLLTYWYFMLEKKADRPLILVGIVSLLPGVFWKFAEMTLIGDKLNVLYTLALGLILISILEKLRERRLLWWENLWLIAAGALAIYAYGINADYGVSFMGLNLIFALYLLRNQRLLQSGFIVLWGYFYHYMILGNGPYASAMFIPAILLLLYNNQPGWNNQTAKRLFYWFYPAHLLLIGLCNVILRHGLYFLFG